MNLAQARTNMVNAQILPHEIYDRRLITQMRTLPRESFILPEMRSFAYSDMMLPVGGGRMLLKPMQLARMVEALALGEGERVLVVGAGTGYEVSVIAGMGMDVFALESDPTLVAQGKELAAGENIQWKAGELAAGWPEVSPFDGILLCGAVAGVSNKLIGQLGKSGRLVAITGRPGDVIMTAVRLVGIAGGDRPEHLFETVAPTLPGFEVQEKFEL